MRRFSVPSWFQFQSGTIKGIQIEGGQVPFSLFQFQSGTIKGMHIELAAFSKESFNSNLVQLKGRTDLSQHYFRSVSIPIWYN